MLIRTIAQIGDLPPGTIVEKHDAEARALIRAGFAEPAPPGAVATTPRGPETTDLPGPRT